MDSKQAAAVRDAINGCPNVVDPDDEDLVERDKEPRTMHTGKTYTGDRVEVSGNYFRPAYIEQSGTLSNGDGASRPVYVVVLESLWTEPDDARCLSSEMVHEVARHGCTVRFYPPDNRLDGDVWICDHFQPIQDANGDRCEECQATYFKLRDGEPVCARCGTPATDDATASEPKLEDYT